MHKGSRRTTFSRIIKNGFVNFSRNVWLAIAAMAVMVITLSIILFSVIINETFKNTVDQITSKINISIYLKDDVSQNDKDRFIDGLKSLPNVEGVTYLSKNDALKVYMEQNKGNAQLLQAINETDNPLPATIQVKPHDLNEIKQIRSFIEDSEWKKFQSDPASDNGDRRTAINNITHATNLMSRFGVIAVIVFTIISVLIIFNTIQMAIFNRRDELQIMRLLGASTNYIRGPFIVETIIYGVVAALVSVLLLQALLVTASSSLQATSFGIIDIAYARTFFLDNYWKLLLMQLALGILIGAASSAIATRRYLKFKTPKK